MDPYCRTDSFQYSHVVNVLKRLIIYERYGNLVHGKNDPGFVVLEFSPDVNPIEDPWDTRDRTHHMKNMESSSKPIFLD